MLKKNKRRLRKRKRNQIMLKRKPLKKKTKKKMRKKKIKKVKRKIKRVMRKVRRVMKKVRKVMKKGKKVMSLLMNHLMKVMMLKMPRMIVMHHLQPRVRKTQNTNLQCKKLKKRKTLKLPQRRRLVILSLKANWQMQGKLKLIEMLKKLLAKTVPKKSKGTRNQWLTLLT